MVLVMVELELYKKLVITRERIRQIELKALRKMRIAASGNDYSDYHTKEFKREIANGTLKTSPKVRN